MSDALCATIRALVDQFDESDRIATNCFFNMHLPGLHSITLIDDPQRRVRMYIATESIKADQLAYHAHSYSLNMHVLHGPVRNETACFVLDRSPPLGTSYVRYHAYEYRKENGKAFFYGCIDKPTYRAVDRQTKILSGGMEMYLHADDYHTVECGPDCAWLITELPFEPNGQTTVYAPVHCPKPEATEPRPMTHFEARHMLLSLFVE